MSVYTDELKLTLVAQVLQMEIDYRVQIQKRTAVNSAADLSLCGAESL